MEKKAERMSELNDGGRGCERLSYEYYKAIAIMNSAAAIGCLRWPAQYSLPAFSQGLERGAREALSPIPPQELVVDG